jgi:hypothetical protein
MVVGGLGMFYMGCRARGGEVWQNHPMRFFLPLLVFTNAFHWVCYVLFSGFLTFAEIEYRYWSYTSAANLARQCGFFLLMYAAYFVAADVVFRFVRRYSASNPGPWRQERNGWHLNRIAFSGGVALIAFMAFWAWSILGAASTGTAPSGRFATLFGYTMTNLARILPLAVALFFYFATRSKSEGGPVKGMVVLAAISLGCGLLLSAMTRMRFLFGEQAVIGGFVLFLRRKNLSRWGRATVMVVVLLFVTTLLVILTPAKMFYGERIWYLSGDPQELRVKKVKLITRAVIDRLAQYPAMALLEASAHTTMAVETRTSFVPRLVMGMPFSRLLFPESYRTLDMYAEQKLESQLAQAQLRSPYMGAWQYFLSGFIETMWAFGALAAILFAAGVGVLHGGVWGFLSARGIAEWWLVSLSCLAMKGLLGMSLKDALDIPLNAVVCTLVLFWVRRQAIREGRPFRAQRAMVPVRR